MKWSRSRVGVVLSPRPPPRLSRGIAFHHALVSNRFGLRKVFIDEGTFKARVLDRDEPFPMPSEIDVSDVDIPVSFLFIVILGRFFFFFAIFRECSVKYHARAVVRVVEDVLIVSTPMPCCTSRVRSIKLQ